MSGSAELLALADAYERHVRGIPMPPGVATSPFAALLLDEGGWRADGMARTRTFLAGILETYAERGRRDPRTKASKSELSNAVGLMWGIDAHPKGAAAVIQQLSLPLTGKAVQRWPRGICGDEEVRRYARSELRLLPHVKEAIQLDLQPRRPWDPKERRDWPPTTWERGRPESWTRERETLVRRVGAHFPGTADDQELPGLSVLAQTLAMSPEETAVTLLRDAVAEGLLTWFKDAEETEHSIWVRNNVCSEWFSADLLTNHLRKVASPPSGRQYGPAVAAVAQLLAWDAVDRADRMTAGAVRRLRASVHLNPLAAAVREAPSLVRPALPAAGLLGPEWNARRRRQYERLIRPVEVDSATLKGLTGFLAVQGGGFITADEALAAANAIRVVSDSDVKREMIEKYLRSRPTVWTSSRALRDQVALALADQSVGWDSVTSDSLSLARQLSEAVLRQPSGGRWAYMAHVHRNLAVLNNKHGRWGDALVNICDGLEALDILVAQGEVVDERERESTAQQLFLAGAGIAVRRVETALRLVEHRGIWNQLFVVAGRAALWFSRAAQDSLAVIERAGWPSRRHDDGQIATPSWRVQCILIRLRALLGVRTAIEAGLLTEADLRENSVDVPLTPLEPVPTPEFEVGLDAIVEHFRVVARMEELTPAHMVLTVPLAAWLAFLNRGEVPVVDNPTPAFVDAAEVLGRRDEQEGMTAIPLDVEALHRWLAARGIDCLFLSWLKRTGPVYRRLTRTSDFRFAAFRDIDDLRDKEFCHD
ncbi:hypothetical protein [Geodermatophilus normandii]|uniref:Uncharacterized protein n=1 Tax=Geodermatophilus normandii TaxID=1137989 RepID=A0A6P0GLK3_9ACTN|nr:hypothetical protein [Geodermatophilus normandii]NEM08170.1 hypothetical protein [Geodermatophilus normandii]